MICACEMAPVADDTSLGETRKGLYHSSRTLVEAGARGWPPTLENSPCAASPQTSPAPFLEPVLMSRSYSWDFVFCCPFCRVWGEEEKAGNHKAPLRAGPESCPAAAELPRRRLRPTAPVSEPGTWRSLVTFHQPGFAFTHKPDGLPVTDLA